MTLSDIVIGLFILFGYSYAVYYIGRYEGRELRTQEQLRHGRDVLRQGDELLRHSRVLLIHGRALAHRSTLTAKQTADVTDRIDDVIRRVEREIEQRAANEKFYAEPSSKIST